MSNNVNGAPEQPAGPARIPSNQGPQSQQPGLTIIDMNASGNNPSGGNPAGTPTNSGAPGNGQEGDGNLLSLINQLIQNREQQNPDGQRRPPIVLLPRA